MVWWSTCIMSEISLSGFLYFSLFWLFSCYLAALFFRGVHLAHRGPLRDGKRVYTRPVSEPRTGKRFETRVSTRFPASPHAVSRRLVMASKQASPHIAFSSLPHLNMAAGISLTPYTWKLCHIHSHYDVMFIRCESHDPHERVETPVSTRLPAMLWSAYLHPPGAEPLTLFTRLCDYLTPWWRHNAGWNHHNCYLLLLFNYHAAPVLATLRTQSPRREGVKTVETPLLKERGRSMNWLRNFWRQEWYLSLF